MKRNRKRILRDPQARELEEWEEEDAFEPNGMLKDGYSLRVPLYMKDGTPVDDGFSRAIVDSGGLHQEGLLDRPRGGNAIGQVSDGKARDAAGGELTADFVGQVRQDLSIAGIGRRVIHGSNERNA